MFFSRYLYKRLIQLIFAGCLLITAESRLYAGGSLAGISVIVAAPVSAMLLSLVPKPGYFYNPEASGFGYSLGPEILQLHSRQPDGYATQYMLNYTHARLGSGYNLYQARVQPTFFSRSMSYSARRESLVGFSPYEGFALGMPVGIFFDGQGGASAGIALEYYLPAFFCKLALTYEAFVSFYSKPIMHSVQFGVRNPF